MSHLLTPVSRRALVGGVVALTALRFVAVHADPLPSMVVHRSPTCSCCESWVAAMRKAGFAASVVDEDDISAVKARLKVPDALASCHTAEVGGYVVEGHTPADAVKRLLKERPNAIGLAVPGMPNGSPGMDMGGPEEAYDVVLFGPQGQQSYGRYRGANAA